MCYTSFIGTTYRPLPSTKGKIMKTVLLLGGPASGRKIEIHGTMRSAQVDKATYHAVPLCSHGEVFWFGVMDLKVCPVALLVGYYAAAQAVES